MSKLKNWSAILVLMLTTQSLLAQSTETDPLNKPAIPASILRIGVSPVNLMQSESLSPGLNIEWEKPLTARFTVSANLYRDLSASSRFRYDEGEVVASSPTFLQLNDIRTSLSFSLNYYFKPYAYDGFYVAFRTNNALAEVVQYSGPVFNIGASDGHRRVVSQPRRGLYLGYRKVFDSGFFVDGSVGLTSSDGQQYSRRAINDHIDFKLTLGWQLRWGKKKK